MYIPCKPRPCFPLAGAAGNVMRSTVEHAHHPRLHFIQRLLIHTQELASLLKNVAEDLIDLGFVEVAGIDAGSEGEDEKDESDGGGGVASVIWICHEEKRRNGEGCQLFHAGLGHDRPSFESCTEIEG
jgi:hypothetical protein